MKYQENTITQEYLKSILDYDHNTGIFKWKIFKCPRASFGKIAGYIKKEGYVEIKIDGVPYKAHRLAFLYINGWLPEEVDHINNDGPKSDNRICNLREATRSQNEFNKPKSKRNTSGYKGVSLKKSTGRWCAKIRFNKNSKHLGYYSTPEEAHEAYKQAALRLHGEYANF